MIRNDAFYAILPETRPIQHIRPGSTKEIFYFVVKIAFIIAQKEIM